MEFFSNNYSAFSQHIATASRQKENFTSAFGRLRPKIAPNNVPRVAERVFSLI